MQGDGITVTKADGTSVDGHNIAKKDPTDLAIAKVFAEIRENKIDFAHRAHGVARAGSRELRAVKIPASYDAWRPPKR